MGMTSWRFTQKLKDVMDVVVSDETAAIRLLNTQKAINEIWVTFSYDRKKEILGGDIFRAPFGMPKIPPELLFLDMTSYNSLTNLMKI